MENDGENYYLSWGGFQRNLKSTFADLATEHYFKDVTLVCEGEKQIATHKVVLSASSPFFKQILIKNPHQHPLVYLKGVRYLVLSSLIEFIYFGEVKIRESDLQGFLALSEELEVKGVSGMFIQPEVPKYATEEVMSDILHNFDALDIDYETDLDKAVFIDEKEDELSESVFKNDLEDNHKRPKHSVSSSVYSGGMDDNLLQESPIQTVKLVENMETLKENPKKTKCSVSSSVYSEVDEDHTDQDTSANIRNNENIDSKSMKRKSTMSLSFFSRSRSKERRRKREKSSSKLTKKLNSSDNLAEMKYDDNKDDGVGVYQCLSCDTLCKTREGLHRHRELKDHY